MEKDGSVARESCVMFSVVICHYGATGHCTKMCVSNPLPTSSCEFLCAPESGVLNPRDLWSVIVVSGMGVV